MGKAFEKQIKTIEDQGKKQTDAFKVLEPKGYTKPIGDKSNNQSEAEIILYDLIEKRKKWWVNDMIVLTIKIYNLSM